MSAASTLPTLTKTPLPLIGYSQQPYEEAPSLKCRFAQLVVREASTQPDGGRRSASGLCNATTLPNAVVSSAAQLPVSTRPPKACSGICRACLTICRFLSAGIDT